MFKQFGFVAILAGTSLLPLTSAFAQHHGGHGGGHGGIQYNGIENVFLDGVEECMVVMTCWVVAI